jgi:hypothetical protein
MIQKLKMTLLSFSALFMFAVPLVAAGSVGAVNIRGGLCEGADLDLRSPSSGGSEESCRARAGESNLQTLITRIINVISVIVGVVAVIMIIYGGFRYITSGGNESSVSAAKSTILYALIGLIIVALAQVIVKFVLQNTPG